MTVVIDASAVVQAVASAPGLDPVAHLDLVAPALLWSEVTSALNRARWSGQISGELATAALERLLDAPIGRRSADQLYREAFAVANDLGWAKTYDAEYLALAKMLDTKVISLDARLKRRAEPFVEVISLDDALT